MSGPKGGRYSVRSAELERQRREAEEQRREAEALARAVAQATAERDRLVLVRERSQAAAGRYGVGPITLASVPSLPAESSSAAMLAAAERMGQTARAAEERLAAEIAAARGRLVADSRTRIVAGAADAGEVAERHRQRLDDLGAPAAAPGQGRERAVRVASRLRPGVTAAAAAAVESKLAELLSEESHPGHAEILALQELVAVANDDAERSRGRRVRLDELASSLAGIADHAAAAGALKMLDEARALDPPPASPTDPSDLGLGPVEQAVADACDVVGAAERRGRRRAEREHAASALREALVACGYSVEEGFRTALAADGFAHALLPGRRDYAVEVEIDPRREQVSMRVVRAEAAPTATVDDVAAEGTFCGTINAIAAAAAARGLDLQLTDRFPAGAIPMVATPLTEKRFSSGAAGAARPRARELG